MEKLNLPEFSHRIKNTENNPTIWDPSRKKYVALTPEEWVRQNFLQYLVREKKVPAGRIATEMTIDVNGLARRTDITVFDAKGIPLLVVECKAASVPLSQKTFDQIAAYNSALGVPFLVVTNGLSHVFAINDPENQRFLYLRELPLYADLLSHAAQK